ncbi:MAG: FIST C-terminal domain-containing protein [Defluviitaleaceae bacterium]|nr:FIST C-terminal domain-containing protein [Defluviitaleaceae bacterium]
MIKAVSIYTTIIDDIPLACEDLKNQIDSKLTLLKNSIGIVQCDPEFLENGIMEPLHNALGIPLVGGTTVSIATNDVVDDLIFSMLILTSDDVEFAASRTNGLMDDYNLAIEDSMKAAIAASQKPLKMALIFPTVTDNENLPGDCYVEAVESVCGRIPVFGTLSVNDAIGVFDRSISVFNGDIFKRELSYVLFFGDISPRFFIASVPSKSNINDTSTVITKSDGHIVQEINNMPVSEYFESIGFALNGKFNSGIVLIPILVDNHKEGESSVPFMRAMIDFNEDGHVAFRGKIPEGARITFGSMPSTADILTAIEEIMEEIAKEKDINAALFFSCIVRQLTIGSDPLKELALVKGSLGADIPFVASYSGGEIAPIGHDSKKNPINSFHNYSLIACLF